MFATPRLRIRFPTNLKLPRSRRGFPMFATPRLRVRSSYYNFNLPRSRRGFPMFSTPRSRFRIPTVSTNYVFYTTYTTYYYTPV